MPHSGGSKPPSNRGNYNASVGKDPRKVSSNRMNLAVGESFDDYALLDCVFGVPLFDERLNRMVCEKIIANDLLGTDR